ncbi:MAG TPA: hypothetical protein VIL94_08520, partial [Acidothermaceae bacterium]
NLRMQLFLLLTPVIFCGILEQPWSIDTLTWGTPAMLALLAASPRERAVGAPPYVTGSAADSQLELATERPPLRAV